MTLSNPTNTQSKIAFCSGGTKRKGINFMVKGHITMIPVHDTPLLPNTSSLKIPIENLHSFRRYTVEGNFRVKGQWAKVKSHSAKIP
jgi:hypothetical protein